MQLNIIHSENGMEYENINDPQESGLDKMAYQEIIEAIRQLTPVYRTVFNLFVIEGYKHNEIAKLLHISEGTSKSQLSHAKKMLQSQITILKNKENGTR